MTSPERPKDHGLSEYKTISVRGIGFGPRKTADLIKSPTKKPKTPVSSLERNVTNADADVARRTEPYLRRIGKALVTKGLTILVDKLIPDKDPNTLAMSYDAHAKPDHAPKPSSRDTAIKTFYADLSEGKLPPADRPGLLQERLDFNNGSTSATTQLEKPHEAIIPPTEAEVLLQQQVIGLLALLDEVVRDDTVPIKVQQHIHYVLAEQHTRCQNPAE
ncbi:MAG: hypothetical protein NVSMB37_8060 [Candidatus Saccharimonadales bacterium]